MIIDSSVAMKWVLQEAHSEEASALLLHPDLAAPSLLLAEVGHALAKRVRRGLATPQEARAQWRDIEGAPLRIVEDAPYFAPALDYALQLHATLYDCLFLALAVVENDVLMTADPRFAAAVRSQPRLAGRVSVLGED